MRDKMNHKAAMTLVLLAGFFAASLPALAAEPPLDEGAEGEERVPVSDNFGPAELSATGGAIVVSVIIGYWGEHIVGFPEESFSPPDPESLDWRVSTRINPDPDLNDSFLFDAPNLLGNPVLVVGLGSYYGAGAVGSWLWKENDWIWDTRHEFLALAGAIAWTEFFIQSSKFAFGRKRPRVVRRCDPPDDPCDRYGIPPERNTESNRHDGLSFPGGHVGATAAAVSLVYLDLSDYLVHDLLSERSAAQRLLLGRALPLLPTYGLLALVFYERLYSQEHWLSDQVVGASAGLAAGHAFYVAHFEASGEPRRRRRDASRQMTADKTVAPLVFPGGAFGLGWRAQW